MDGRGEREVAEAVVVLQNNDPTPALVQYTSWGENAGDGGREGADSVPEAPVVAYVCQH